MQNILEEQTKLRVVNEWPPNIEAIRAVLDPKSTTTFCYGSTVYNPSGKEIAPEILYHESIHTEQQGDSPEEWWNRFLTDPEFRLEQELEAYAKQYEFVKRSFELAEESAHAEGKVLAYGKSKSIAWALEGMARALSCDQYALGISHGQAVSLIRNYDKEAR